MVKHRKVKGLDYQCSAAECPSSQTTNIPISIARILSCKRLQFVYFAALKVSLNRNGRNVFVEKTLVLELLSSPARKPEVANNFRSVFTAIFEG